MAVNRKRSLTRTAAGTLAIGMMAAVGAVATAPTAQARTAPSGQIAKLAPSVSKTFTLPKGVSTYTAETGAVSTTLSRTAKQAQLNITCTLHVYSPYKSADKVHAAASVNCTGAVSRIRLVLVLYKNGWPEFSTVDSYNTSWVSGSVWVWYSPGRYELSVRGTVWFPPGYNPPFADFPPFNSTPIWL
ncbi:hypothetical protein ACFVIM_31495 [Streptomyces sp. NPDC057638]|uniref:hypothetical protein n=1 Tax=Streptomyces sp. NPDC057638 TaxID=3346190 RepID=UPI00367C8D3C